MTRRLRLILGLIALAGVGAAGAFLVRSRFPNWFDREEADPGRVAELKDAALSLPASQGDWWQWRGPTRDGRAPDGPLRTDWAANPPKVLWSAPCGGGYSSCAVVGGRVFTQDRQSGQDRVICLDAETGKPLWTYASAADYVGIGYGSGPRATPLVAANRVYAVGATGILTCLNDPIAASQLTVRWKHDLAAEFKAKTPTWGFASSPLLEGNLVVVQPGGKEGSVAAFDADTGEKVWAAGSDPGGYSSPVAATLGGVRQIVAVTGTSILGVKADTGEVLWRHPWETQHNGNIATPVVVGDYVFVSSGYGKGCVLLKAAGSRADVVYFRKGRVMKNHHSTCVFRDGFLYGYDDNELKCVNLRTGEEVEDWGGAGRPGKGSLTLAGDKLLGLTESGTLFLAGALPEGFALRGKLDGVLSGRENWAAPVLVGGRVYLRDESKVVCLDVR